jgi:uncharacterized protein YciI
LFFHVLMARPAMDTTQTAVEVHDERLKAVEEQGARLVSAGHFAADAVAAKVAQLREERAALGAKLDARRKKVCSMVELGSV